MDPLEIPKHNIETAVSPEARIIRAHTPQLFLTLIEQGSLENIESISDVPSGTVTALEGGVSSACYFLENNGDPRVIKFRSFGISSEAESLNRWRETGVSVPEVKSHGVVQLDIGTREAVKYLILEGIVDSKGKIVPTGDNFFKINSEGVVELGSEMGKQLYLMHQAKYEGQFGGFGDMRRREIVSSWDQYLARIITTNQNYLLGIGISNELIERALGKLADIKFPPVGSYIHTDYGTHNTLIEDTNPLKIRIFDPNPLIGDPYFDLAGVISRLNYHKSLAKSDSPDGTSPWASKYQILVDSLIETYTENSGEELDQVRLLANLIGVEIPKTLYAEEKGKPKEVDLRRNLIKDYFVRFTS